MLTPQERQTLKLLLNARFDIAQLRELVTAAAEDWDSTVRLGANKLDAIQDILDKAKINGWIPRLLAALIQDLSERLAQPARDQEVGRVRQIEQEVLTRLGRGTALHDPFESCFISVGLPYVNRPPVRQAFEGLTRPGGLRLVVISGPPGAGKTYSKELPVFVSEILGPGSARFKVCFRPLGEGRYGSTATDLARSILLEWKLPNVQIPSDYAARPVDLSLWLLAYLPAGETWWLVIDGLAEISPDRGLVDFVMALASQVADTTADLRLVLLDPDEQSRLPANAAMRARTIRLEHLTQDDLVEYFFRPVHAAAGPRRPFDSTAVVAKAEGVLQKVAADPDAETGLTRLKDHLLQAAQELGLC